MSHLVTMKCKITDLDALDEACKQRGVELVRGQQTFKHFAGRRSPCTHAIRVPNNPDAYEIGVILSGTGQEFSLQADEWAGAYGMTAKVGQGCEQLAQEYAVQTSVLQLMSEGYQVQLDRQEDGRIFLTATE